MSADFLQNAPRGEYRSSTTVPEKQGDRTGKGRYGDGKAKQKIDMERWEESKKRDKQNGMASRQQFCSPEN